MHDILHAQTQVIQCSELIVRIHCTYRPSESRCPEHKDASEIEVIPQCALLACYKRMPFSLRLSVRSCNKLIMIGIQHIRTRILGNRQHTVEGKHAHLKRQVFGIYEYEFL